MEVILTPDYEKSLRKTIYEIALQEFQNARNDVGIGRPLNQVEIAEFLQVSTTTIREWENLGMPHGSMGTRTKYYDASTCKKWVLSQQR